MGFDLYGENPVMREIQEDTYPVYNKYAGMDFKEQMTAFEKDTELKDQYYEEWRKRDKENPGTYFRNNVWWWRRLWQFVCVECEDILSEEDKAGGESNNNHLISQDKAVLMAKKLQEKIDDGSAKAFQDAITKYMDEVVKDKHGNPKNDDDFMANYPFLVSNLQEFILFCSESGGFRIG